VNWEMTNGLASFMPDLPRQLGKSVVSETKLLTTNKLNGGMDGTRTRPFTIWILSDNFHVLEEKINLNVS